MRYRMPYGKTGRGAYGGMINPPVPYGGRVRRGKGIGSFFKKAWGGVKNFMGTKAGKTIKKAAIGAVKNSGHALINKAVNRFGETKLGQNPTAKTITKTLAGAAHQKLNSASKKMGGRIRRPGRIKGKGILSGVTWKGGRGGRGSGIGNSATLI